MEILRPMLSEMMQNNGGKCERDWWHSAVSALPGRHSWYSAAHGAACLFLYCDWYLLTIYVSSFVLRMGMSRKRARNNEGEG